MFFKRWPAALPLLAVFALALALRVVPAFASVFQGGEVRFCSVDVYYYLRQVDSLARHFPHLFSVDPYLNYPSGLSVGSFNFFVYLLGGVVWLAGRVAPGQHAADAVSAWFPALLGALTVVPVYYIGKNLFDRRVGLAAAVLTAVLPAQVMTSVMGNTQRDVLEVLLTTLVILFLVLAQKSVRERRLELSGLNWRKPGQWSAPLGFSLLCGLTLGLYNLTWRGSFFFVIIILLFLAIQATADYFKDASSDGLLFTAGVIFLTALTVFAAASRELLFAAVLAGAFLSTLALWGLGRLLRRFKAKPLFFPLSIVGLGLAAGAIILLVKPSFFSFVGAQLRVFAPSQSERAVMEMQPLLLQNGRFTFSVAWGMFNVSFFLSLFALLWLGYLSLRKRLSRHALLLTWGLATLAATLDISRMAPFLAVPAALLSGCMAVVVYYLLRYGFNYLLNEPNDQILVRLRELTGREPQSEAAGIEQKNLAQNSAGKHKGRKAKGATGSSTPWGRVTVATLAVLFIVIFPNFSLSVKAVDQLSAFAPSDAWSAAMAWLQENTPAPFGDAAFYYETYQPSSSAAKPSYTVAALWDYGYWIARISQRCPSSDPGGGARASVAALLLAQNETAANNMADQLGSHYVIIDDNTVTYKLAGTAIYNGEDSGRYYGTYYKVDNGVLKPVTYYYPEYYQTLAVRLYLYDGAAVTPAGSTVISYLDKVNSGGQPYRELQEAKAFASYGEAAAYLAQHTTGKYRIASPDVLESPVPLAALSRFRASFSSSQFSSILTGSSLPEVRIFTYSG